MAKKKLMTMNAPQFNLPIVLLAATFFGIWHVSATDEHESASDRNQTVTDPFGIANILISSFLVKSIYLLIAVPIALAFEQLHRRPRQPSRVFWDVFTGPFRWLIWSVGICLRVTALLIHSLPRCVLTALILPYVTAESLRGPTSTTPGVSPWRWACLIVILLVVIPPIIAFVSTRETSEEFEERKRRCQEMLVAYGNANPDAKTMCDYIISIVKQMKEGDVHPLYICVSTTMPMLYTRRVVANSLAPHLRSCYALFQGIG